MDVEHHTTEIANSVNAMDNNTASRGEDTKENQSNVANCNNNTIDLVFKNTTKLGVPDSGSSDQPNNIRDQSNLNVSTDKLLKNSKPIRKRLAVLESDSDDESDNLNQSIGLTSNEEQNSVAPLENSNNSVRKRLTILDSDSDEDSRANDNTNSTKDNFSDFSNVGDSTNLQQKRLAIIDSDSDHEVESVSNASSNEDTKKLKRIANVDAKLNDTVDANLEHYDAVVSRVTALCDDDSDDANDSRATVNNDYSIISEEYPSATKVKKPSKKIPTGDGIEKKMTAKQAIQQRQEIRSASQKRVRERHVSLPYHKPKSHSIKEFLLNRPKLSLSLINDSTKTPPALALKMTTQELEEVTKKLEEREKVVQQFYMSESESEESEDDVNDISKDKILEVENSMVLKENENIHIQSVDDNNVILAPTNENLPTEQPEIIDTTTPSALINESGLEETYSLKENKSSSDVCEQHENLHTKMKSYGNEQTKISEIVKIDNENSGEEKKKDTFLDENSFGASYELEDDDFTEIIDREISLMEDKLATRGPEIGKDNQKLENITLDKTTDTLENTESQIDTSNTAFDNNLMLKEIPMEEPVNIISKPLCLLHLENSDSSSTQDKDNIQTDNSFESNVQNQASIFEKKLTSPQSEEFGFNLDDLEVTSKSESNIEDSHLEKLLKKYGTADNHSLPKAFNKLELLKQKVGDYKPRLSGSPDQVIDLDEDTIRPNEVSLLVKRFIKHNVNSHRPKHKVELDVINFTQGEVQHEKIAMSVDPEEEPVSMDRPGTKIRKLRHELQTQIAQRRSELWQQKIQSTKEESLDANAKDKEEKLDGGANIEDEILDDEEEAELTDESFADDEEDDDDEDLIEQEKNSSKFIDGEAEETDADDEYEENDEVDESERNVEEDVDLVENLDAALVKKPLRRILQGFTEDSDEEDDMVVKSCVLSNDSNSIAVNIDDDDERIPPNQPRINITPQKSPQPTTENVCFTPITHSAGLEKLNSESKFLQDSPASPHLVSLSESTQNTSFQRKLFSSASDISDAQPNCNMLDQLCSGNFTNSITEMGQNIPCTQDLLNLCSGSFPATCTNKVPDVITPNATIITDKSTNSEIKTLSEDKLISELLDEEEMEIFKKKFESPVTACLNTTVSEHNDSDDEIQEVQGGGLIVTDSSDEEDTALKNTFTKKLKKKLAFSDEEEDKDESNSDSEEIDLHDNISNEEDENNLVDYDSEENEIEVEQDASKMKLTDFLENEAELSESEWGSADEDEQGLDVLETEQGDADVFDENQIRNDLEKIHMRRVLDQDNKEIKILQELLLEDGDLHGTGRQRQFRWNNIDEDDNLPQTNHDVDVYFEEEDCEEQWRKSRHQREMFFKKKQEKSSNIEEDDFISSDSNSQLLKLGQQAVRRSLSNSTSVADKTKCQPTSPAIQKPLLFVNTRGSFLARNDKFLTRLAEFTKVTTETVIKTSKSMKGFVFQTLGDEDETSELNVKKRKAADKTPLMIKKLRLTKEDTSPASVNSKKKLF